MVVDVLHVIKKIRQQIKPNGGTIHARILHHTLRVSP